MPFVSDIVGPQHPVEVWPTRRRGSLRRTSTIDTHPTDSRSADVDLRSRDVLTGATGKLDLVGETVLRAQLTDRAIVDIDAAIPDERLDRLRGARVGPGFRATVGEVLGPEIERSTRLHLLLDDWAGASLVSGYATQHATITDGLEEKMPDGVADRMAGICAGFAPEASLVGYARRNGVIPCVHGPIAPDLAADDRDGMHSTQPLRPHGMRRMRRMDVWDNGAGLVAFDGHFRDTHVDGAGVETIVHEYTVDGVVNRASRTVESIMAQPRVLPWQECPAAIGSASRTEGMALSDLRSRVKAEFVGTSTCTHLNDTLRALGDLESLIDSLDVSSRSIP
jgi:hypothetical protein